MRIFRTSLLGSCIVGLLAFAPNRVEAEVCSDGTDGAVTVVASAQSQILNTYYPSPLGDRPVVVAQGSNEIRVETNARRGGAAPIASGDLLLILQVQGAAMHVGDEREIGGPYGDGPQGLDRQGVLTQDTRWVAGRYEFNRANGAVGADGTLALYRPTKHAYTSSDVPEGNLSTQQGVGVRRYQVIRVPDYQSLRVEGQVTSVPWDGRTGGVIAIDTVQQLVINGVIDASGMGFRGGLSALPPNDVTNWDAQLFGQKGEGLAGTPTIVRNYDRTIETRSVHGYFVDASVTSAGPGAPGNAGGAGFTFDSGGGGGAGAGAGGVGGCGRVLEGACARPSVTHGGERYDPGLGGAGFVDDNRLFMGGGGGSGRQDDVTQHTRVQMGGYAGGGIVLLRSPNILGQGLVRASGQDGDSQISEGAGGGGGGGQIWLITESTDLRELSLEAGGGRGTEVTHVRYDGGGGGGGGGLVAVVNPSAAANQVLFDGFVAGGLGGAAVGETFRDGLPGADGVVKHLSEAPEGMVCDQQDSDGDGVIDFDDLDDDNDGILDTREQVGGDVNADQDGDGIPNHLDRDSDNDGVADVVEAGGVDADNDGEVDNFVDINPVNGVDDGIEANPLPIPDTDGDGLEDYLDVDSDGDGITDPEEAGLLDADGDGVADGFIDADEDGVRDTGLIAEETRSDNDDLPDRIDLDSDDDTRPDATEGHDRDYDRVPDTVPLDQDTNQNGLDDAFEPSLGGTTAPLPDEDNDGVADYQDPFEEGSGGNNGGGNGDGGDNPLGDLLSGLAGGGGCQSNSAPVNLALWLLVPGLIVYRRRVHSTVLRAWKAVRPQ